MHVYYMYMYVYIGENREQSYYSPQQITIINNQFRAVVVKCLIWFFLYSTYFVHLFTFYFSCYPFIWLCLLCGLLLFFRASNNRILIIKSLIPTSLNKYKDPLVPWNIRFKFFRILPLFDKVLTFYACILVLLLSVTLGIIQLLCSNEK